MKYNKSSKQFQGENRLDRGNISTRANDKDYPTCKQQYEDCKMNVILYENQRGIEYLKMLKLSPKLGSTEKGKK